MKIVSIPPKYGRQRVGKVAPATSVAHVYGLGRLVSRPQNNGRNTSVKVRRGRSK